jgi:hypothetical protein
MLTRGPESSGIEWPPYHTLRVDRLLTLSVDHKLSPTSRYDSGNSTLRGLFRFGLFEFYLPMLRYNVILIFFVNFFSPHSFETLSTKK